MQPRSSLPHAPTLPSSLPSMQLEHAASHQPAAPAASPEHIAPPSLRSGSPPFPGRLPPPPVSPGGRRISAGGAAGAGALQGQQTSSGGREQPSESVTEQLDLPLSDSQGGQAPGPPSPPAQTGPSGASRQPSAAHEAASGAGRCVLEAGCQGLLAGYGSDDSEGAQPSSPHISPPVQVTAPRISMKALPVCHSPAMSAPVQCRCNL